MRNRIFQYLKTGVAGLTLTAGILMLPIEAQALEQEQTPEITVKDEALGGALHGLAGEGTETGDTEGFPCRGFCHYQLCGIHDPVYGSGKCY